MDWLRIVLDGFIMAAYFNLLAALLFFYNPRYIFPSYPEKILKDAKYPPTKKEKHVYFFVMIVLEMLPLLLYSTVSTLHSGTHTFWDIFWSTYIQWMIINFCDLFFLDYLLVQKKCKAKCMIVGTENHPGYTFSAWMKEYALPEHLLQWPLFMCPFMGLLQAGISMLFIR